jgi:hypothetical protein
VALNIESDQVGGAVIIAEKIRTFLSDFEGLDLAGMSYRKI